MYAAACTRAAEAAALFAHVRPDGTAWWSALVEKGLSGTFTELLAHAGSWEAALIGFAASPAHAAALAWPWLERAMCQSGDYWALIIRLQ